MLSLPGVFGAAVVGLSLLSCGTSALEPEPVELAFTHLGEYDLRIEAPSGLSLDAGGRSLWVVGDRSRFIYRLDLRGAMEDSVSYAGQDPEGIAFDPADSTVWLVEERVRQVVHLDLDGRELRRNGLAVEGDDNSGLEGICVLGDGSIYVLNEKNPATLMSVNHEGHIEQTWDLDFAADASGLAWDHRRQAFWIVSDQDRTLYLWSPERGLIGWHCLGVKNLEGIAYDADRDRLYCVSETAARLYHLEPGQASLEGAP